MEGFDDFIDFVPDTAVARERSVFMSARPAPRTKTKIIFRVFIGNKVLEQLLDAEGRNWLNAGVEHVFIRVGTGAKSGQMVIAASRGGNITLHDYKNGRAFHAVNMPGIQPMKSQEVKWQIAEDKFGKILHITEYKTGEISLDQVRKSDAGAMPEEIKAEVQKQASKPSQIMEQTLTPPPPPSPRETPSKADQYRAMSSLGKKK